jgi:hypothetical protein
LQYYTPHQQLSVDEGLVETVIHTQLLQYLPSNHHHHQWGIKLWILCDSAIYHTSMWHFSFYLQRIKTDVDEAEFKKMVWLILPS